MDAVEYLKERARMCRSFNLICSDCPLFNGGCGESNPDEAVDIVEQWSKEHPVMTNAMKFEEVFGCSSPKPGYYLPDAWWDEPYKEPEGKE